MIEQRGKITVNPIVDVLMAAKRGNHLSKVHESGCIFHTFEGIFRSVRMKILELQVHTCLFLALKEPALFKDLRDVFGSILHLC